MNGEEFGSFSHFSYEVSYKEFLITDLQGFGYIFIDPTIHTMRNYPYYILEKTNLKDRGVASFFGAQHE